MKLQILTSATIRRRQHWIKEIVKISGNFGQDVERIDRELTQEIDHDGLTSLLDHLRLCGAVPESYRHDSSEEKLYSKYTDTLLAATFRQIGFTACVLIERADAADVEVVGKDVTFVADAKVFRLSRTAKNQKDFKMHAMDGWRRGKSHATVVCPLFQLPSRASQIYQQAAARNVCIFSYSHLGVLASFGKSVGSKKAQELLRAIFRAVETLNPSKDANAYWAAVNRTMLDFHPAIASLWSKEKEASLESIEILKEEALIFLSRERERIMKMSHQEAIKGLLEAHKFENKIKTIRSVTDNGLLGVV